MVQIVAFAAAALVKDIHRLTRLRDPEDQECCIGARRDTAVPVIDVDSRFAETCGSTHAPCLLKTSAEAMVIKILPKKEMRGNPKRKLSPAVAFALCAILTSPRNPRRKLNRI